MLYSEVQLACFVLSQLLEVLVYLALDLFDGDHLANGHEKLYRPLSQLIRKELDSKSGVLEVWNGKRQDAKRVKAEIGVSALGALNPTFKLPIERVDHYRLLSSM